MYSTQVNSAARLRRANRRSTDVTLPYSHHRLAATLAAVAAAGLCGVATFVPSEALAKPITSPKLIQKLAAKAYVWGLAPEFVYRFEKYNTLATAPLNTLGGGAKVAAVLQARQLYPHAGTGQARPEVAHRPNARNRLLQAAR